MGRTDAVAPDPSVADYRATSPRNRAGRNMIGSSWALATRVPAGRQSDTPSQSDGGCRR